MKQVSPQVKFPQVEQEVLEWWKEQDTFKKSLAQREGAEQFFFYDGPPFANGSPHYGHLLQGTVKDIVPRYQTMRGKYVERRFGWDTHGLPIEMEIEKQLNLKGRLDILDLGVGEFNETCRKEVFRLAELWEQVTNRLGRWIDFENDYKTMDVDFMESVWWVVQQLWEKGLIYEGTRVMPYSWRLSTSLSNFEAGSNYQEKQDPAITVRFKVQGQEKTSLLAWTTTPWTLISNLALCVGPEVEYVEIVDPESENGETVILARERLETYFPKTDLEEVRAWTAAELSELSYLPPFDFFAERREEGCFRVLVDGYVTTSDGTGIVHQAPAFGEDDHRVCMANGLPLVDPVDAQGNFDSTIEKFNGQNIFEAAKDIIADLKERGLLYRHETLNHSYPFCDRSNTPLMYKAVSAWYVKVEHARDLMVSNNDSVHWVPEHIKQGRFGNWLREARDWNISRNRFWGNPIPLWRCPECGEIEVIGSRAELEERSGQKVTDLHKHFVDELTWECKACDNGTMQRIPEVLDCWFESGSMPYAQLHYPFENKDKFEDVFPAHFIAEATDQTRGWFYTLMVLSTLLYGKAPFRNVICTGMILAEDGKKMSKRLKNYPDPMELMNEHGADALRLYMISSPVVRAESLRFSEQGVKDIVRSVLLPFWNVYSFFTTYASVDGYTPSEKLDGSPVPLDRWIISRCQTLFQSIEQEMESYKLYAVVPGLLSFIEDLTNWYIRRSRRRFWSEDAADKQHGYDTILYVLLEFSKALAPFLPFVTEEIYQNLRTLKSDLPESVHLCDYPRTDAAKSDAALEEAMELIQQAVSLGRSLRAAVKIKTRQPMASITVVTRNEKAEEVLREYGAHIKEELNVKEVLFSSDEAALVDLVVKPNFPKLGPIFGKQMGVVAKELKSLTAEQIAAIEAGGTIEVLGESLGAEALDIRRVAKSKDLQIETGGGITVFFDTALTDELRSEGYAREVVNRVQRMRKAAGFNVSDRIEVQYHTAPALEAAIASFGDYIRSETLMQSLQAAETLSGEYQEELVVEEDTFAMAISRVK